MLRFLFSLYSLCVCPTVCLSICLSDYLSMPLSLLLCVRLSFPLSLHLSVRLSACPSACLSVCPSVCQSASQLDKLCQLPSPTPHSTCFRHFALIKFITNVIHTHTHANSHLYVSVCVWIKLFTTYPEKNKAQFACNTWCAFQRGACEKFTQHTLWVTPLATGFCMY